MTHTRSRRHELGAVSIAGAALALGVGAAGVGIGFTAQRVMTDDTPRVEEIAVGGDGRAVPVFDCPGDPVAADVHDGDRVFAIATHAELDGWLLIRNPADPAVRWWIRDAYVDTDAGTDGLPAQDCEGIVLDEGDGDEIAAGDTTTSSTTEVDESTTSTEPDPDAPTTSTETTQAGQTTTSANPTTAPTTTQGQSTTTAAPTTTTTTTAPPDTSGPTIGTISRSRTTIYENDDVGAGCPSGSPTTSTISAAVNDASGLKSVRMAWSISGGGSTESGSKAMSFSAATQRFSATLGPFGDVLPGAASEAGTITVTIQAVDNADNSSARATTVTIFDCTFG